MKIYISLFLQKLFLGIIQYIFSKKNPLFKALIIQGIILYFFLSYNLKANTHIANQIYEEKNLEQLKNELVQASLVNDSAAIYKVNFSLGIYFKTQHQFDSSKIYLLRFLEGMKRMNNVDEIVKSLKEITLLCIEFNKYDEAVKILENNLNYAKLHDDKHLIKSIYGSIYWLYKANSNYKKALESHEMFLLYSDSIQNQENINKSIQMQQSPYREVNSNQKNFKNSYYSNLTPFLIVITLLSLAFSIYILFKSKIYNNTSKNILKDGDIRAFLDSIDDFLLIVDKAGIIKLNNRVMCDRLGYKTDELEGKNISVLLNLKESEFQEFIDETISIGLYGSHKIIIGPNNEEVEVKIKVSRGLWKHEDVYFVIFKDLTESKKSEEIFSKAFHSVASAMAISNLDNGFYIEVNESFCRLSGYSYSEIIGSSSEKLSLFIKEEDRRKIKEEVQKQGYIKDFLITLFTKSGDLRFVNYSASIIQLQHKKYVIAVFLDITEKKQMEDELCQKMTELSALLRSVPAMIYFKDSSLRYVTVNELFAKKLGYHVQDITGKTDYDLFTKEESDRFSETDREVLEKGVAVCNIEDTIQAKDGSLIHTLTSKIPFKNENGIIIGMVGSSINISKIKDAEENLAKFSIELQRSNSELEQFAYIASHDLQEPLRKVQAFSDRLRIKYADKIDEAGRDYIDRMQSAANRMMEMISGLLEYSRITTKAKPFTLVDLNEIIRQSLSDLEIAIDRTGAKIEVSQLPQIYADSLQMGQLFSNLISNAIKYQEKDNTPIIQIDVTTEKYMHHIYIKDNGIGFDEAYMERIFQPFQRLHGRSEYEGSGIGLAICQKIVQRHNGTISAKSKPGEGSTFIITLPIQQAE